MAYSAGKHAFGFCDRSGFRYPLKDLVWEVRDGKRTGMRIGKDMVDPDHPQNFLGRVRVVDPQSLRDPRPDTAQSASRALGGWNPVGHPEVKLRGAVAAVTVVIGD